MLSCSDRLDFWSCTFKQLVEPCSATRNPAGIGGLTDEDEVPDLPEKTVTKVGEIWLTLRGRIRPGLAPSLGRQPFRSTGQSPE